MISTFLWAGFHLSIINSRAFAPLTFGPPQGSSSFSVCFSAGNASYPCRETPSYNDFGPSAPVENLNYSLRDAIGCRSSKSDANSRDFAQIRCNFNRIWALSPLLDPLSSWLGKRYFLPGNLDADARSVHTERKSSDDHFLL